MNNSNFVLKELMTDINDSHLIPLSDGSLFLAWQTDDNTVVKGQRYSSDLNKLGNEVILIDGLSSRIGDLSTTALSDGSFVIAFSSDSNVFFQKFSVSDNMKKIGIAKRVDENDSPVIINQLYVIDAKTKATMSNSTFFVTWDEFLPNIDSNVNSDMNLFPNPESIPISKTRWYYYDGDAITGELLSESVPYSENQHFYTYSTNNEQVTSLVQSDDKENEMVIQTFDSLKFKTVSVEQTTAGSDAFFSDGSCVFVGITLNNDLFVQRFSNSYSSDAIQIPFHSDAFLFERIQVELSGETLVIAWGDLNGIRNTTTVKATLIPTSELDLKNKLANKNLWLEGKDNANDILSGKSGDDVIKAWAGDDVLRGASGNDILLGGIGVDTLVGGVGKDIFKFVSASDSGDNRKTADKISDFRKGYDRIDVSKIDANPFVSGDQAFQFVEKFSTDDATGQLIFDAKNHVILGSVDKDAEHEFMIIVNGTRKLDATDFIL